jgi:NADH-quinone oxidoreductase subunit F
MIRDTSLCGLGTDRAESGAHHAAPLPHEFEDHIVAKRCRAGVCEDLALSPCENSARCT